LALESYETAIRLKPEYADAYWNKAVLKLLHGKYQEGWQLYEWRWQGAQKQQRREDSRLWLGAQPVAGKTLLVYPEQGLGDFIQFCRYLPLLVTAGVRVILEVPSPLLSLLATLPTTVVLIEQGSDLPNMIYAAHVKSAAGL